MEVLRRRDGEFILWRNISPTLYFSLLQGRRSSFPSETATKFAAVESSPPGPFLAGLCSSLLPLHGSLLQQPLSCGSLVGREKDEGVYHLGGSSRGVCGGASASRYHSRVLVRLCPIVFFFELAPLQFWYSLSLLISASVQFGLIGDAVRLWMPLLFVFFLFFKYFFL